MNRILGFIPVPISVATFAHLARAYDEAFPGCTVGHAESLEVKGAAGTWIVEALPVLDASA